MKGLKVLLIDNFDSFTYNLADEFEKHGCRVEVYRNNVPVEKILGTADRLEPDLVVISPGPGTPGKAGNSIKLVKKFSGKIPLFGVCLGEQAIIESFGGSIGKAVETMHGKSSLIKHDNRTIFTGVENPFQAGRYHSLSGQRIPKQLEVSAKTDSGIIMGVRHKKIFAEGVQFHPESILTPQGGRIIQNLLEMVRGEME